MRCACVYFLLLYMYVCVYMYIYIYRIIYVYIHIYTKRLITKNNYGVWQVWNLQGRLADFGYKLPVFQFESRGCLLLSQEELLLQMKSEGSVQENSLLLSGGRSFCSIQAFDWLGEAHHVMEHSLLPLSISSKNILTETLRIMFNQLSGGPKAQSSWSIKLTITTVKLVLFCFFQKIHQTEEKSKQSYERLQQNVEKWRDDCPVVTELADQR